MGFSWLAKCVETVALIVFLTTSALAQNATRVRLIAVTPSSVGQPVTLTAEVDTLGGDRPIGPVSFADGARTLGSASLSILGAGQSTLSAGGAGSCALSADGGFKCWGEGSSIPRVVEGLETGVVAVTGGPHGCVVTELGGVKCFFFGRDPYEIGLSSEVISYHYNRCAVTTAGVAKCWGDNRLQDNGYCCGASATPGVVASSSTYVAAVSGRFHKCALTSLGGVECWGANDHGQVGDGTTGNVRPDPTPVVGLSGVVALTAGIDHTCAVTAAGALKCWGVNLYGALGDGTRTVRASPVQVSGLGSGVVAASAGYYHTCALMNTGAVRCWGHNSNGQLGDLTTTDRLRPTSVVNLGRVAVAIASGGAHTCALLASSRTVMCWGANGSGQIGDGTTTDRLSPTRVVNLSGVLRARARLTTSALGAGWHLLRATYPGDRSHRASSTIIPHGVQ
jgi:hypothetical protein